MPRSTDGTIYLLDTCVIVNFDDEHHFDATMISIMPLIASGNVRTSRKVMDELQSRWKPLYRKCSGTGLVLRKEFEMIQEVVTLAGTIAADYKLMRKPHMPGNPADPWLIALGKHYGYTVVSDERGRNSLGKIPGVCNAEGVRCIAPHAFASEVGITLRPRP